MKDQVKPGTGSTMRLRAGRVLATVGFALGAAGICIGLGGLVWIQNSSYSHAASNAGIAGAPTSGTTSNSQETLEAPANSFGVPRAEDAFAKQPGLQADNEPTPSF